MTAPATDTRDDTVDEELRDSLAIHAAFKGLGDVDVTEPVPLDSDMFATLVWHTAHEFFDAAHAERCRLMFENAVKKAGNIPDEAKAALLELHELYDLKQFDSYGRAGIIVGIAAGLQGMGAHYVGPEPDEPAGERMVRPAAG